MGGDSRAEAANFRENGMPGAVHIRALTGRVRLPIYLDFIVILGTVWLWRAVIEASTVHRQLQADGHTPGGL